MKKVILFTAVATMLSTAFISCKKETPQTPASQTPIPQTPAPIIYPEEPGSVASLIAGKKVKTDLTLDVKEEFGLHFKSSASGNIKSLKLDLPVAKNYLVTLWTVSDHTIVTSKTVTCSNINTWKNSLTVNISIKANTEYILSLYAPKYNSVAFTFKGTFPYINGSITLLGYKPIFSGAQAFPTSDIVTEADGFVDFTFQKASS